MATPTEPNSQNQPEGNTPAVNTPAATPAATPAVTPAATPQSQPNTQTQGFDASELLTALNSLPEKIVNSLREATQPAKAPTTPKTDAGTGQGGNGPQTAAQTPAQAKPAESHTPQRKTFAEMWFGR